MICVGVDMRLLVLRGIIAYISKIRYCFSNFWPCSFQISGCDKVRKRVTLMVVIISGIFTICWGTLQVLYSLLYFTSYEISPVVVAISNAMVLFNSAVTTSEEGWFDQPKYSAPS